MANGDFLKDVSSGIFNRLRELDKEQVVKDEKEKLQTIELLSGMAGQIEPDSLPLLMGHIGKTIGVKGELKGFWDAFSGMPNRSVGDQLGTILKDVGSSSMGPSQAKQIRAGGDMARLFQPQTPEQETNRAGRLGTESSLTDRLIFRDPIEEKERLNESRYGLQLQGQRDLLEERHRNALAKQDEASRLRTEELTARNQMQSMKAINELSNFYLAGGKASTIKEAIDMAGDTLGATADEKLNALRTLAPLRRANTEKAQIEAKALKVSGGLKPTDIDRRTKNYLTAQENFTKSEGVIKGIDEVQSNLLNSIDTKINYLPGFKFKFDPKTGTIETVEVPAGVAKGDANFARSKAAEKAQTEINEYNKNLKQRKSEEERSGGYQKSMDEYQKLRVTTPKVTPNQNQPSTKRALKPGERVGLGTARGIVRFKPDPLVTYEPNKTELFIKGRKHIVVGIDPDGTIQARPVE